MFRIISRRINAGILYRTKAPKTGVTQPAINKMITTEIENEAMT